MFTVLAGGHNSRHSAKFFMSRPKGQNEYLLLLVKSEATFSITSNKINVAPNSVILIDRNTPYQYYNPNGEYIDDWLYFDCSDDTWLHATGIVFNNFFFLANSARITSMIQQILWENNYALEQFKQENVTLLLRVLLNNLIAAYQEKGNTQQQNPYYSKMQKIRLTLQSEPGKYYKPKDCAEDLAISLSYFQHLYTEFFGISFQADLIHMRIEQAKGLLTSTNLTIEQIAELCGYTNEVHFYRQFRKKTGTTPSVYKHIQN